MAHRLSSFIRCPLTEVARRGDQAERVDDMNRRRFLLTSLAGVFAAPLAARCHGA
jgi:hypothetical protein